MAFAQNIEQFRLVDGYDNYEVSSHGRIRNNKTARILIPGLNSGGYHHVSLCKDGKNKSHKIHRLVSFAFCENLNNYTIVDHNPDYVVVGEGRTFNMENIDAAVQMIYNGAKLIGTNLDTNCPTDSGIRSGCGAIIQLLESATGKKALTLGKPSPIIMREAKKELSLRSYELSQISSGLTSTDLTYQSSFRDAKNELSLRSHEIAMIGDTMETDILGGMQMGFYTILVLSGGTSIEDLSKHAYGPNQIVKSIAEIKDHLFDKESVPS